MAALDFPNSPTVGQKYPASPIAGIPQYTWDGEKWFTGQGTVISGGEGTVTPLPDADPAAVGASFKYAREDHVHPANFASVADFRSNVAGKYLLTDKVWSGAGYVALAESGALITPNFSLGFDFLCALTGAGRTLQNPTAQKGGQKGVIYFQQPSGGACTITAFGTAWKFAGGVKPVLTLTANAVDALSYAVLSTDYILCSFVADIR